MAGRMTPRARIEGACREHGKEYVVSGCIKLLRGGDVGEDLIRVLAGDAATWFFTSGDESRYWLRVWAARGLLWTWDDRATGDIVTALNDEHWRVREMSAKVCARHGVDDALEALLERRDDQVPRVRAAAARAVRSLTAR